MKKIRITTKQMLKILETETPKFPLTIIMRGIDKAEMDELVKLLKTKKKD
ncbi:MAG: hypothetical protein H7339_17120 [Arcicella sp.]|nr:hypothetical protein [Arcicella sp.]